MSCLFTSQFLFPPRLLACSTAELEASLGYKKLHIVEEEGEGVRGENGIYNVHPGSKNASL